LLLHDSILRLFDGFCTAALLELLSVDPGRPLRAVVSVLSNLIFKHVPALGDVRNARLGVFINLVAGIFEVPRQVGLGEALRRVQRFDARALEIIGKLVLRKAVVQVHLFALFGDNILGVLVEPLATGEIQSAASSQLQGPPVLRSVEPLVLLLMLRGTERVGAVSGGVRRVIHRIDGLLSVHVLLRGKKGVTSFFKIRLLVPNVLNVVLDVGWAVSARSVDGELHVEAHVRLTTGDARVILQGEVEWRSLETAEVRLTVVEAEDALDFLGSGDSLSYVVDLGLEILLATDAAGIGVTNKAVRLKGWVVRWRGRACVASHPFVVVLSSLFVGVISFVHRDA
jgi:hypothetical protein